MDQPPPKRRQCGHCKGVGHDRRNCPHLRTTSATNLAEIDRENRETLEPGTIRPPPDATITPEDLQVPWDNVVYCLFDLETTGLSRQTDEIIEVAAVLLSPDGIGIEDAKFDSFIKPTKAINNIVTRVTGITNEMVAGAPPFRWVLNEFFEFIQGSVSEFSRKTGIHIDKVIFVAHNGRVFDVPFLLANLERNNLQYLLVGNPLYGLQIDTLDIARKLFRNTLQCPTDNELGSLYQFFTGREMESAHRAVSDVRGLYTIFRSQNIWNNRKYCCHNFYVSRSNVPPPVARTLPPTDSDEDDMESVNEQEKATTEQAEDEERESGGESEDPQSTIAGDFWQIGDFVPTEIATEKFQEVVTSTGRSGAVRTGLQVSPVQANSPMKAWRLMFTNNILDKITRYTNRYGELQCNDWQPIDRTDVTDFISVLFLMSIQRRKDKPANWFSNNPLLACPVAKKITTGIEEGSKSPST